MNITAEFVLRHDVLLIPCEELSGELRSRITFDRGDFTLSRRHGRALSQVVDGETAALLTLFRKPRTIVDAVLENSRSYGRDPAALLDELLPHLGRFLQNRVLVPAGEEEEQELRPRYDSGTEVAGWTVVRCASLIEDTEIYQVERGGEVAGLKIARLRTPQLLALFENELAVLRHLGGEGAPRLLDGGVHEEHPYLLMEWIDGVESAVAAAQRRHDRVALVELGASIAGAYAALHARGVIHADVHPRNVLVGSRGVTLLDFGFSRLAGTPSRTGRGGMYYFYEPEFIESHWTLPASEAGEQYALAALLYLLCSGQHYLDFRFEREEMERQVKTEPPLPFASRGLAPWPGVEEIVFRGLEKDPARRFGSIAELAARLGEVRESTAREALATPVSDAAHAFLEETLRSFARGGKVFESRFTAPTASINCGAAGAAVGLLRIAETRSDPALLALADVWKSRALALIGNEDAYYNAEIELSPESLGEVSPYHTESGIHAAAAMVAAAFGDTLGLRRAIGAFLQASSRPGPPIDLTLGRCGNLLAASMLLDLSAGLPEAAALRAFGAETMRVVWEGLEARPVMDGYLGLAHGWAGYFYAAMRWCTSSGDPLPARLEPRLHDYAELRTLKGRGAYWRIKADGPEYPAMPAWCHGSGGQVFLFTLAHRMFGGEKWLRLAEECAWTTWDEQRTIADLCCGTAGRAYVLLNLYKHTGATEWLSRARQLANHAASAATATAKSRSSLWKGELGVAVLIADLASPENARMPFFE